MPKAEKATKAAKPKKEKKEKVRIRIRVASRAQRAVEQLGRAAARSSAFSKSEWRAAPSSTRVATLALALLLRGGHSTLEGAWLGGWRPVPPVHLWRRAWWAVKLTRAATTHQGGRQTSPPLRGVLASDRRVARGGAWCASCVQKKKDPNAPKKPLSAYMFFCAEHREEVKTANPDFKATQITSELGRLWGTTSEVSVQVLRVSSGRCRQGTCLDGARAGWPVPVRQ